MKSLRATHTKCATCKGCKDHSECQVLKAGGCSCPVRVMPSVLYGVTEPGPVLMWKAEGLAGPVILYPSRDTFDKGFATVTTLPGVVDLGWMTRAKAKTIAKKRNAFFVEV